MARRGHGDAIEAALSEILRRNQERDLSHIAEVEAHQRIVMQLKQEHLVVVAVKLVLDLHRLAEHPVMRLRGTAVLRGQPRALALA